MSNVTNQLRKSGYNFRAVVMSDGSNAIMIDTNYTGWNPDAATYRKHADIQKIARRNGMVYEDRGHKTAALLTF